ncbi:MAG: hypothetical protein QGG40_22375 [Myxococcota bacterium]|jgi:hypothetical protein|nr:hypothetical protein [Myxococcota bacterium]
MGTKRSSRPAETSFALWGLVREGDRTVFRGEQRWWKWPVRKWSLFVLTFFFVGGLPLFAGFMWASEAVYSFEGEQVIVWDKLIGGAGLIVAVLGVLGWFSIRSPREWQARSGQLCIDGRTLASGQVKAFVHQVKQYEDSASEMGVTSASRLMQIYLVLLDGSEQQLAGFDELGMSAALEAVEALGATAGVRVVSRREWDDLGG